MPLSAYVPPVTITPPIVNAERLERMALVQMGIGPHPDQSAGDRKELDAIYSMLPHNHFSRTKITVPLRNVAEIRSVFRAIYRMNQAPADEETVKQRVSFAFETLKSVNELKGTLNEVQRLRDKHYNREGVEFSVGQVVRHKKDRWRAIVLAWARVAPLSKGQLTSLTTKEYGEVTDEYDEAPQGDRIRYTLNLDSGDAHLLSGNRQISGESGYPTAYQQDLELVQNLSLCRIRSYHSSKLFDRFEATSQCFVPNNVLQFEYPMDVAHLQTTEREASAALERNEIGASIVEAIQSFTTKLLKKFPDELIRSGNLRIIADLQEYLGSISIGYVVADEELFTVPKVSDAYLATAHLRQFHSWSLQIAELLWHRRRAAESLERLSYRLGDIVWHRKYDFRGVVVGWDPKPTVDVSNWDGLGDIDNPQEKPFYHVIPDQGDCIRSFGGEREFRYVCEDNLEPCPSRRSRIDIDLDLDWDFDEENLRYIPPAELAVSSRFASFGQPLSLSLTCVAAL